jgi:MarR family transcriptional regulator, temperature-dependent positive regulator of motility
MGDATVRKRWGKKHGEGSNPVDSLAQEQGPMSGKQDVKQLARSLSHLLKRAVQYSIHLYMSEAGKSGLTHRQFTVLLAADAHEGRSQTELVKMTGIDRSTLADLVARLMAQGYVQRRRTKDDARTNAIRLTPIGKKMLKQAQSGAEEVDRQLLAILPNAERKSLLESLTSMASEMDKVEEKEPEKTVRKVRPRRAR